MKLDLHTPGQSNMLLETHRFPIGNALPRTNIAPQKIVVERLISFWGNSGLFSGGELLVYRSVHFLRCIFQGVPNGVLLNFTTFMPQGNAQESGKVHEE